MPLSAEERERAECALAALIAAGALAEGARVTELTQLEGGWSRRTHLLDAVDAGGEERELVVRVKPSAPLLDTSLRQEYETCRALQGYGVAVPAVHAFEDATDNPFGGAFYVMDRAPGSSPNVWRPRDRVALEQNWEAGGSLAEDLVENLVRIHAVPPAELDGILPRRDLAAAAAHWEGIQAEHALVRDPVVEDAYAWLRGRPEPPGEAALVHGDYRIGNCLNREGRVTAVLDWELSYLGDPRYDVGYISLEYASGKFARPGSRLLNSVAEREWFLREYERRSGREVDPETVRTFAVLAALMLIAILTTGIRMYADGRSDDIRMAWTRFAIPALRQELTTLLGY
jgi:aminoglycoside phosphotransferase (APT) family kinase protein